MDIKIEVKHKPSLASLVERLGSLAILLQAITAAEMAQSIGKESRYSVGIEFVSEELQSVYEALDDIVN